MLRIISNIFAFFVNRRNKKFDDNLIPIFYSIVPVISIGNLSAGGTGKTPFTLYIANQLILNGIKPAIIARGYKSKSNSGVIVCDGVKILSTAEFAGDEMLMIAKNLLIPIVTHNKKYLAAEILQNNFNIDCILIDDGFQHRFLHRDLDIILIDNDTINNPYLIPKGRLRENLTAISRADIICINENVKDYSIIDKYLNNKLIIRNGNIPIGLFTVSDNKLFEKNKIENVIAFSGIAKNINFYNSLKDLDIEIIKHFQFSDHHIYRDNEINSIINYCLKNKITQIITTEKDSVKMDKYLNKFFLNNIELLYLKLNTFVNTNSDLLISKLLNTIRKSNE